MYSDDEDPQFKDTEGLDDQEYFLPEVNVFERVGFEDQSPQATRLETLNDPLKRFLVYTNATAINMSVNKMLNIDKHDINEINRKALIVENPMYKNSLGFVLGYFSQKDGNGDVNVRNFNYIEKNLSMLAGDKNVKMADVLRYARLWIIQL